MTFRNATRVVVVFAATAALAQSAQPGTTPGAPVLNRQAPTARRGQAGNKPADTPGLTAMRDQLTDMESTLSKMQVALKQLHAQAAKSKTADPLTKANLNMWDLMVGHLDKEVQQMRVTLAAREDMEVRRAALYKQADAKAEAEVKAARASQAARFDQAQKNATGTPTPAPAGQSAEPGPAAQSGPAQSPASSSTNNPASPN